MSKFKYQMLIQWSDEDNCFLVGFPDFPGQPFRTHGDTYEEAVIVTQTSLLDVIDPLQMYGVVEALQRRTGELEAEKIQLLKNRNIQLEQQVQQRTASLQLTMHREKLVAGISALACIACLIINESRLNCFNNKAYRRL